MQIDLFTLLAEIVNFLILIWLLHRFLYQPIVSVMREREQKIADRLDDAEQLQQEAQDEIQKYRQLQEELDARHDELMHEAREEANDHRQALIEKARDEVDEMRHSWQLAVQQEKDAFLYEFEQRIGHSAVDIARRALNEMADEHLESQVIEVFVRRLQHVDDTDHEQLVNALRSGNVQVESAFALSDHDREMIEQAIRNHYEGELKPDYRVRSEMLCGVRLTTESYRVSWSFEDYTASLRQQFARAIDEVAGREREAAL